MSEEDKHTSSDTNKSPSELNTQEQAQVRGVDNLRDVLLRLQTKLHSMRDSFREEDLELDIDDSDSPVSDITQDTDHPDDSTDGVDETDQATDIDEDATKQLSVRVDRETRQTLRRVQNHLISAQKAMGAQHEVVSLVEAIYHPDTPTSSLNYIMPRRKTAWVSSEQVQMGIDYLRERNRRPRVIYIEGLLPPLFARNLRQLNLHIESETPLMVYLKDGLHGEKPPVTHVPKPPYDVHLETVTDVRGAEVWWYVWQNAYYDVFTLGVEPIYVGRSVAAVRMGHQIDLIAYRGNMPFGVARVTVHQQSAHVSGVAVFREMRTPDVTRLMYEAALHAALQRGCDLVFAPGESDTEREIVRSLGFMDFGSIVCYAAETSDTTHYRLDDTKPLVQPILNLR